MANTIFDSVSGANPQRSNFDLSHDRKYTLKGGEITPIFCQEVVPGDKFNINTQSIIRLIPMVGPTMHKINMDIHWFYIPNRILWKNWEKFITGSKLAGAEAGSVPVHPYLGMKDVYLNYRSDAFTTGQLADYLGYPVADSLSQLAGFEDSIEVKVNSLPMRAYMLIYKEFYRDQNLTAIDDEWNDVFETDGSDNGHTGTTYYSRIMKRCWEKDYFTSALPFVQKGDPLRLPMSGNAQVKLNKASIEEQYWEKKSGGNLNSGDPGAFIRAPYLGSQTKGEMLQAGTPQNPIELNPNGTFYADLTNVSSATINELRSAFQAQLWLERNARAGTRYIESLEAHFGVRPEDYRLQRPELFGASRIPIQISEVLQTSSTEAGTSPQGNMAGHGIGFDKDFCSVFCPEHGWIIGVASVLPRTSYMYAVNKSIFRLDYLEYMWPEFARLGEQEVKKKELGYGNPNGTVINPIQIQEGEEVFGYQSRYAEYRSALSTVHGGMKKDPLLRNWHMSRRNVNMLSDLNTEFVEADPTTDIFADTTPEYEYIVHTNFNVNAKRPIPYFTDPGFIDHP